MASCSLPPGFLFGVASSAYQIEGAISQDGKGENCVDRYCRTRPEWTEDRSDGSVACDSYNRRDQDLALIEDLGVDYYRFSVSWSRIAPNGDVLAGVNQAGLEHYRGLISGLLQRGITPMVTIFHWDMPQQLQDLGGWANKVVIDYFVEYARLLFKEYGDMVRHWYTVNEPQLVGMFGYGGGPNGELPYAPGVVAPGIGDYLAQHHQLIAHARVYRLYQAEFRQTQKGEVGVVFQASWAKPKTTREEDIKAAKRILLFELDVMLHPLIKGDYPTQLREIIDGNSAKEGRVTSRLPVFTPEEIELIKGSFDFIGLNHYSTALISHGITEKIKKPSQAYDMFAIKEIDPKAHVPGVFWLAHEPEGIRCCLNYIREEYGRIPLYIAENGCDDPSGIHDVHRIQYMKGYLRNVIEAVNDGCNVLGYTVWSFMDSFEWVAGYKLKFGLYHVDFESPERKRSPKDSVKVLKEIIKTRTVPA